MHSHTGVEKDIELPFEELEPCCQKEILNNRKEKEFKEKIRAHDRSNVRLDAIKSVFKVPHASYTLTHTCCHANPDYDLLANLKDKVAALKSGIPFTDEENDSDDDFLDDDDYMSPAQQDILKQVAAKSLRLHELGKVGLGSHLNDSPTKILQLYQSKMCNIVLHIIDNCTARSALIDVIMHELAQQYTGTYFRWVHRTAIQNNSSQFFKDLSSFEIVCIREGKITSSPTDMLSEFFSRQRIDSLDEVNIEILSSAKNILEKYLSNANVLSESMELLHNVNLKNEGDLDDDKEESYCNVKGCGRLFPHKHISSASDESGVSSSLLLNASYDSGIEALNKSHYSSL